MTYSAGDAIDLRWVENEDSLARNIGNLWMNWNIARQEIKDKWQETIQYVYATSTSETSNAAVGGREGEGWSHSTHIPKIAQIFDNLGANYLAALMPHDNFIEFQGQDNSALTIEKRQKVEAYLSTKHRLSKFRTTLLKLLNDWILYGNCFAQVYYERESYDASGVPTLAYSGPRVRVISPHDIVFNPIAASFESSPKIVRTLSNMGELMRRVEETPDKYLLEGIEKFAKFRQAVRTMTIDDMQKYIHLQIDGFGSIYTYFQEGNVEILDLYGDVYDLETGTFYKNRVITVVDRRYIIRNEPVNTTGGRPYIFHCGWRLRPDNLWAMGPLDNLVGMQYLINHLENARADAFDQMLLPTRVIVGDVEEEGVVPGMPGGTYRIPSGDGSVTNLMPDQTVLQADMQINLKAQQMEEFVGSPKEAMGIRTPGEKTAFEVNSLQTAAGRIFQHKINYFEEEFEERIFNAELAIARENIDAVDQAMMHDDEFDIDVFVDISPEDLNVNGKLIATGARHYARKAQMAQNLMQMSQAIGGDQMLQQHFPSFNLAEAWSDLLEMEGLNVIEKWGRVREQADLAKTQAAYQDEVQGAIAALHTARQEEAQGVQGLMNGQTATSPNIPTQSG